MISAEGLQAARLGEEYYRSHLQEKLESSHRGQFVCIEPVSGDYFLGRTLEQAIRAAEATHPERRAYVCRIGFSSVMEIGFSE